MDNEKLLRDAGLNKYESSAYLTLLKEGVIEAGELSRSSKIPMGKIYEVLKTLEDLGFVEVQRSRPKKYRPIDPKIAFDDFYSKKEGDSKRELEKLKDTVSRIKEELSYPNAPSHFERTFWSTVMGEEDLIRIITRMHEEVKDEVCVVHHHKLKVMEFDQFTRVFNFVFSSMFSLAGKSINIKVIIPNSKALELLEKMYDSIDDISLKSRISDYLEIRILDTLHNFVVIDDHMVVLNIENPVHMDRLLGMVKIYDRDFSREAKTKFDELWEKGEGFELAGV